jgi:hypothetical protein
MNAGTNNPTRESAARIIAIDLAKDVFELAYGRLAPGAPRAAPCPPQQDRPRRCRRSARGRSLCRHSPGAGEDPGAAGHPRPTTKPNTRMQSHRLAGTGNESVSRKRSGTRTRASTQPHRHRLTGESIHEGSGGTAPQPELDVH